MQFEELSAPMHLIPFSVALGELNDVSDARHKLLALCIERSVHVYVAVPPGHVVIEYPYAVVKQPAMADLVFGGDHRPVVSNTSRMALRRTVLYLRLSPFDLRQLRDAGACVVDKFHEGGLNWTEGGYSERKLKYATLARGSFVQFSEGQAVPVGSNEAGSIRVTPDDVFLDARVKGCVLGLLAQMTSSDQIVEDRYGHREKAPAVFALYQAAKLYPGEKYNEEAIRKELGSHKLEGVFEGKTADYAVRLIKKGSNRVPQEKDVDGSYEEILRDNELGRGYFDDDLSRRMRLLLLATDYWIHHLNCVRPSRSTSGELDKFLVSLGFTSTATTKMKTGKDQKKSPNPNESQVEYLKRIIMNSTG